MKFSKLILSFILTTLVFFAIDLLWLGVVGKGLYDHFLGDFLKEDINWVAAIIFYLLYIVGIFVFVILPAISKKSSRSAFVKGALFGLFAYATYDLTNLATLEGWPIGIVLIDIPWGMLLTSLVGGAGFFITRKIAY